MIAGDQNNEILANRAWIEAFEGDVRVVARTVSQILNDPRSSAQAVVWACVAGALPATLDGHADVAERLIAHARSLAVESAEAVTPFALLQIGMTEGLCRVRSGRWHSADFDDDVHGRAASKANGGAVDEPTSPLSAAGWSFIAGVADREAGDFVSALNLLDAGLAAIKGDPFGLVTWARSERRVCAAMTADHVPDTASTEADAHGLYRACLYRNDAWVLAAEGEVDDAIELIDASAAVAAELGQTVHELLAVVDMARFGEPLRAMSRLVSGSRQRTPIGQLCIAAAGALASRKINDLLRAAAQANTLGSQLLAWELLAEARRWALAGRDLSAAARIDLIASPRVERTPILADREGLEPIVTPRERAVAVLAAGAMSSRSIADRLVVSARTVDNLLGRVYTKCAFRSRRDLTSFVVEHGWLLTYSPRDTRDIRFKSGDNPASASAKHGR